VEYRAPRRGFWVVAVAFLTVMALETVPSPLYALYRARDHFSLFIVTVAFAVYAIGVIVALLLGVISPICTGAGDSCCRLSG
jgi:hypothetical protein